MKTREDVEALKSNWMSDPCWDIEETEGFEQYHNELVKFHQFMKNKWKSDYDNMLNMIATKYDCSVKLAEYIYLLENRLQKLALKLEERNG